MVFNTISVGTAVAPTVIETYLSHVRAHWRYLKDADSMLKSLIVPQSQATRPKTDCPHLVPPRGQYHSSFSCLRFPSYCRGHTTFHLSTGSLSALGQSRGGHYPPKKHVRSCEFAHRSAGPSWRRPSWRRELVAVEEGR